jgi:hypothetical protein
MFRNDLTTSNTHCVVVHSVKEVARPSDCRYEYAGVEGSKIDGRWSMVETKSIKAIM